MIESKTSRSRMTEAVIHVISWGLFFGFPLFFVWNRSSGSLDWTGYMRHCLVPLVFCMLFYLNYFLLVPKLLFRDRLRTFIVVNIAAVAVLAVCLQLWQMAEAPQRDGGPDISFRMDPALLFFLRDMCTMALVVGLAATVRMSRRWSRAEAARREAERSRSEAELKNLRNQLNPHFLLNTLNNIYALIAFDTDKAQQAVQELSRLLRYVLYDNQQDTVPLGKETEFIRNYIGLMRIRLASNVTLTTDIRPDKDSGTPVAPLIFISLIENAFKHGIAPGCDSRISIVFYETPQEIVCDIRNSWHPKTGTDKSGSGIGLEQVRRRLELLYPGQYRWTRGVTDTGAGKEYRSELRILKQGTAAGC